MPDKAGIPGSRHASFSRHFQRELPEFLPLDTLLRPPLGNQECDVTELNDPDGDISRNGELVIEKWRVGPCFPLV